jgi:hypothetical protein
MKNAFQAKKKTNKQDIVKKRKLTKLRTPKGSVKVKFSSSFQTGFKQLLMTLVFAVWYRSMNQSFNISRLKYTIGTYKFNAYSISILTITCQKQVLYKLFKIAHSRSNYLNRLYKYVLNVNSYVVVVTILHIEDVSVSGVRHQHTWLHSIISIFLNYYWCLYVLCPLLCQCFIGQEKQTKDENET